MSILDQLEFVKHIPKKVSAGISPVEKARQRLMNEIDIQLELARNPEYQITKVVRKRDGSEETKVRKPRAWFQIVDDQAFITMKIGQQKIALGGKRGSVVRCSKANLTETLSHLKRWAQSTEADAVISKALNKPKKT